MSHDALFLTLWQEKKTYPEYHADLVEQNSEYNSRPDVQKRARVWRVSPEGYASKIVSDAVRCLCLLVLLAAIRLHAHLMIQAPFHETYQRQFHASRTRYIKSSADAVCEGVVRDLRAIQHGPGRIGRQLRHRVVQPHRLQQQVLQPCQR